MLYIVSQSEKKRNIFILQPTQVLRCKMYEAKSFPIFGACSKSIKERQVKINKLKGLKVAEKDQMADRCDG